MPENDSRSEAVISQSSSSSSSQILPVDSGAESRPHIVPEVSMDNLAPMRSWIKPLEENFEFFPNDTE